MAEIGWWRPCPERTIAPLSPDHVPVMAIQATCCPNEYAARMLSVFSTLGPCLFRTMPPLLLGRDGVRMSYFPPFCPVLDERPGLSLPRYESPSISRS
jgi:hypothetical protein